MERPERIVLFMIGAFTNRMAAVMWVILVLSIFTVADRIIYTYRELRDEQPRGDRVKPATPLPFRCASCGTPSSGPTSARPGSTT